MGRNKGSPRELIIRKIVLADLERFVAMCDWRLRSKEIDPAPINWFSRSAEKTHHEQQYLTEGSGSSATRFRVAVAVYELRFSGFSSCSVYIYESQRGYSPLSMQASALNPLSVPSEEGKEPNMSIKYLVEGDFRSGVTPCRSETKSNNALQRIENILVLCCCRDCSRQSPHLTYGRHPNRERISLSSRIRGIDSELGSSLQKSELHDDSRPGPNRLS